MAPDNAADIFYAILYIAFGHVVIKGTLSFQACS